MQITRIFKEINVDDLASYILCLLVFAMPFTTYHLSYGIIIAIIATFFQKDYKQKFRRLFKKRGFLMFAVFYLYHIIGLLYTKDLYWGFNNLKIKLSLLLIPYIVFISIDSINRNITCISKFFIGGNLLASIVCLVIAIINSYKNGGGEFNPSVYGIFPGWSYMDLLTAGYTYFNYSFLSKLIHVNYFSMYILMAVYLVYIDLINNWQTSGTLKRTFSLILIIYFVLYLLLLQSRACILSLLIITFIEWIVFLRKKGRLFIKLVPVTLMIALIFLIIFKSGRFREIRISVNEAEWYELINKELRFTLWAESLEVIKKYPVFGVGTGDVRKTFRNRLVIKMPEFSNDEYYNVHNEFLETTLRLGLLGGLFLLAIVISPLKKREIRSDKIYIYVIIIIINFAFESMLDRFNGVIFFAIFYSLLNSSKKLI